MSDLEIKTLVLGPVNANCYIVTDEKTDKTAVIDCGDYTPELEKALDGKNLEYIMLTHGHADHILGVYGLKKRFPNAKIVIHKLDAPCLTDSQLSLGDEILPGAQKPVNADITVDEGDVIEVGSLKLTIWHTPGHTLGGVCYFVESEKTFFTGDTIFCLTVGRTDLYGGNDDDMFNSVKRFYDLDSDYKLYPGHNRSTTLEYEKMRNRYMRRFK